MNSTRHASDEASIIPRLPAHPDKVWAARSTDDGTLAIATVADTEDRAYIKLGACLDAWAQRGDLRASHGFTIEAYYLTPVSESV